MKDVWNALFDASCLLGLAIDDARRLANLTLCATLAPGADGIGLGRRTRGLARHPAPFINLRTSEWRGLAALANPANGTRPTTDDVDGWVRAFQQADPNRKNLGAYATPRSFADALAGMAVPNPSDYQGSIVDPACGAGALLIACLNRIEPASGPSRRAAALRLHGMELDPAARELACLLLWISAGGVDEDLGPITSNVRCGNAILHDWTGERRFDALVMNPPWESLRHRAEDESQDRERSRTNERISRAVGGDPELPPLFSAQGGGDRNLCKAFIELAPHLVHKGGRIAALVPAAFASDEGMAGLRTLYLDYLNLESWTGFENREKAFDIDSRYKFGVVAGMRSSEGTSRIALRAFATRAEELLAGHVVVERSALDVIGGPVGMFPDITSTAELEVLRKMLSAGTPFFDDGELGVVRYGREVDLTIGRQKGLFSRLEARRLRWNDDATIDVGGEGRFVPVVEGRMVGQYDFFQKSWIEGHGRRAVWRDNGDAPLAQCRPQYVARQSRAAPHRIAICDVTSATNTRTVHASLVPDGWICGNTAPVLRFEQREAMLAGLAILNSMTFDWLARRVVSGLHLNKFYLASLCWPTLDSDDVASLASAGRGLAASAPRCPLGIERGAGDAAARTHVLVETIVARGYGLSSRDLRFMLDGDDGERRGFWRYYASNPDAIEVARRASTLLAA